MVKVEVASTAVPNLSVTFDCESWLLAAKDEDILKLADEEGCDEEELLELVTWGKTKPENKDLQHLFNAEEELGKLSRYQFYTTGLDINVDYHALHKWLRKYKPEIWHKLHEGEDE